MTFSDLLIKKGKFKELTAKEIEFIVKGYSVDQISDLEMGQLLKIFADQKMTENEVLNFFESTLALSPRLHFDSVPGFKLDKHSTGGVGDKVTLILLPILVALGLKVFKFSGGRLGFTGGTTEKLKTFPKISLDFDIKNFLVKAQHQNLVLGSISDDISKFERKLYQLRSDLGLVKITGLIVNSIMIKKIILGNDGLIIDVKVGSGSLFQDYQSGLRFADLALKIAQKHQRKIVLVLTDMSEPLGQTVGNKLEVIEGINALSGNWTKDLSEVVVCLASQCLLMSKKAKNLQEARILINQVIDSGKALNCFKSWIENFDGDFDFINQNRQIKTKYQIQFKAWKTGYLNIVDAGQIGSVCNELNLMNGIVDYESGIIFHKKNGQLVRKDQAILTFFTNKKTSSEIKKLFKKAILIEEKPIKVSQSKILKIIKHF